MVPLSVVKTPHSDTVSGIVTKGVATAAIVLKTTDPAIVQDYKVQLLLLGE